mmetsp:Transcript_45237/g.113868  ORF Transcript_45237/g.113868 Transcript_45237/m.113868 type:complete len:209 (-) Transcript_45237:49-675(-)
MSGGNALAGSNAQGIGKELEDINFDYMIGGPMVAVMKAQLRAAVGTMDFIYKWGFQGGAAAGSSVSNLKPSMMKILYDRPTADGGTEKAEIRIPFILLVPIPCISITGFKMNFKAELVRMEKDALSFSFGAGVSGKVGIGIEGLMVGVWVNASYQHQTKTENSVTRKYTYEVTVEANRGVDEAPPGYEQLFEVLKTAISESIVPDEQK